MAFTPATFSLAVDTIAGGSIRIHFYKTADNQGTVLGAGYIPHASKIGVHVNDIVLVAQDGAPGGTYACIISSIVSDAATLILEEVGVARLPSVKDSPYLAAGDGLTNDTPAFGRIGDATILWVPPGAYYLLTNVALPATAALLMMPGAVFTGPGLFTGTVLSSPAPSGFLPARGQANDSARLGGFDAARFAKLRRSFSFISAGAGTYVTKANCNALRLYMIGGGGGGSGSGATAGSGGAGGSTTFGNITCQGGNGGIFTSQAAQGGGTLGVEGQLVLRIDGEAGQISEGTSTARINMPGPAGARSPLGAGGLMAPFGTAGNAPQPNTGAGGGAGGGNGSTPILTGNSGASGSYRVEFIQAPKASYAWTIGTAGTAGTAGTNGFAGGAGSAGYIIVEEFY